MATKTNQQCTTETRNVKSRKIRIKATGDPANPYEIKWLGGSIIKFWKSPPVGTKEGYNIDLEFEFDNGNTPGVTFATPVTAAFGAHADTTTCPAPGSDGGGEIDFRNSSVSGANMTIRDCNVNAGDLNFAVYFSDGSKLDPIIKNTGGGTPPLQ